MNKKSLRPSWILLSGTTAGLLLAAVAATAADMPAIVVEAGAPVHSESTGTGAPGGAAVDVLSVKYHVHLAGVDLTKHADVMKLDEQIKAAAKKGCEWIKTQYPTRSMSDEQTCLNDALKGAMAQEKELVAAAEKKAAK